MKIAQLPSDCENCVRHGICRATEQAAAHWQACEHVDFISVLAMNDHRNAGKFCSRYGFDRSPIARVHDVRTVLAHDADEPEKRELQLEVGASSNIHFSLGKGRSHKVCIEPPGGADPLFKLFAEPRDQYVTHLNLCHDAQGGAVR